MDAFVRDDGVRLHKLINKSRNVETIWEVPKGRKSDPQEKEIMCAVRETCEETGVGLDKYELLLDISPRRMTHMDVNTKYISYIYIAAINNQKFVPKVTFNSKQQISEVVNIAWMTLDQIKNVDSNSLYEFAKVVFKLLKKKEKLGKRTRLHI